MTLSKIEKCARLMGYEVSTPEPDTLALTLPHSKCSAWVTKGTGGWVWFNPLTNKSDLVDLMCAVGIGFDWFEEVIIAGVLESGCAAEVEYSDHPDKQTALAHAVVDVACQIYDRQFGDKE